MKDSLICVTINAYGRKRIVTAIKGTSLKDVLDKENIGYSLVCGGKGICGKCRVIFPKGAPEATASEKEHLTEAELSRGVRLLCKAHLSKDCEVDLREEVGGSISQDRIVSLEAASPIDADSESSFGIAIDLGTTTIAAALIKAVSDGGAEGEPPKYRVVKTAGCANSQRRYGANVISRIRAASEDNNSESLSSLASEDLKRLIDELTEHAINPEAVTVAANTTMLHLLMKRDVTSLGRYPYTPVTLEMEETDLGRLFPGSERTSLSLLPGISAFVGADIVSGLYFLDPKPGETFFFIDLGTNGEMAFFDGERIKVASAAAGSVFEAGGISCGMASVAGAINHVTIDKKTKKAGIRTIGEAEPTGICGTGVIETVAELFAAGIIDETGLLADEFFDEGYPLTEDGAVSFTQQDIRNVQLAKAAVYTGAKALLQGKIPDRVYVSGGFGNNMDPDIIEGLSMFPKEFSGKIEAVGNTSLKGAAAYTASTLLGDSSQKAARKRLQELIQKAEVVELAELDSFSEDYIDAMNFF